MKKKIWRLSAQPTIEDLKIAVEADIISKEEAKEILLREEEDIPKDPIKEIKEEIKLLRQLVMKIAEEPRYIPYTAPIIIKEIERWPSPKPWTSPWITWCSSNSINMSSNITDTDSVMLSSGTTKFTN